MSDQEKMREEFEACWNNGRYTYMNRIDKPQCWEIWQASRAQADAEITKRDAIIAMQAEALEIASDYLPQHWDMQSCPLNKIEHAISASAESVAAWEAGKLESLQRQIERQIAQNAALYDANEELQRQVAQAHAALKRMVAQYESEYDHECPARPTWLKDAIANTQATAEAYDREHAAKVLGEAAKQGLGRLRAQSAQKKEIE